MVITYSLQEIPRNPTSALPGVFHGVLITDPNGFSIAGELNGLPHID